MYQLSNRGMGAGNPDVPDAPCATQWAWAIPTCWQWPKSIIYGDKYPAPPAPPVVGSTLPDGSPIPPVPASGEEANATIDAIIAEQKARANAQNLSFFQTVQTNLESTGIPWWAWLAGGVGVFALVAVSGGSPRRYGR